MSESAKFSVTAAVNQLDLSFTFGHEGTSFPALVSLKDFSLQIEQHLTLLQDQLFLEFSSIALAGIPSIDVSCEHVAMNRNLLTNLKYYLTDPYTLDPLDSATI